MWSHKKAIEEEIEQIKKYGLAEIWSFKPNIIEYIPYTNL